MARHRSAALVAVALGTLLAFAACSQADDQSIASTTTAIAPTSNTTTPATTESTQVELVNMAEPGLLFDYGAIVRHDIVGGVEWIWFERHAFGDEQGVELQSEPRWEMATDWHGGGNLNAPPRTYPLSSGATVLELDPDDLVAACEDLGLEWSFIESDVSTLVAFDSLVSLTFDGNSQVTLVRDQRSC